MLGIENYWIFVSAGLLLNFTPGPDMLYVATRSAAQGRSAGIASALAISTGGLVHTLAAALGLSALLGYSAFAFQVVKWIGALYLVWLGVKTIMRRAGTEGHDSGRVPDGMGRIYAQGLVVSVFNPKVALFFLAFLPQFADPASRLFAWQIALLGLTFCTTATMVNTMVAVFAGRAGRWLGRAGRKSTGAFVSGGVYIAMGLGLAVSEAK